MEHLGFSQIRSWLATCEVRSTTLGLCALVSNCIAKKVKFARQAVRRRWGRVDGCGWDGLGGVVLNVSFTRPAESRLYVSHYRRIGLEGREGVTAL